MSAVNIPPQETADEGGYEKRHMTKNPSMAHFTDVKNIFYQQRNESISRRIKD
jgi:hypothetical protein